MALLGGTGAVGAGALVAGYQARKLGKQAGDALGYASSGVARAAKQVRETVTPEAVARAGMKLVKRKAKQKAVEYFPTFTKWTGAIGRTMKKSLGAGVSAREKGPEAWRVAFSSLPLTDPPNPAAVWNWCRVYQDFRQWRECARLPHRLWWGGGI